jgi:transposase
MRRSFTGLFALVQSLINEDPFAGHLFLFRSREGNFIKIFWFDQDGFAIFAKRLEVGKFRFPDVRFVNGKYEPIEIKRADLMMLLEGIDTGSVKRSKRYHRERRDPRGARSPKNTKKHVHVPKSPPNGHSKKGGMKQNRPNAQHRIMRTNFSTIFVCSN